MLTADAAVASLEANVWSMFSILGAGTGGSILDTPARLVVEAPLPQPPYNAVLRFRDDGTGPLAEQVAREWVRFTRRGVNGVFLRHPTAPDGLDAALAANGLEEAERLAGMALDLTTDLPARRAVDGVDLVEAGNADTDDWVDLVTWRYGLESTTEDYLRDVYRQAIGTHSRLFVARIDGRAVSKVVLHLSDGVAEIYGAATTEAGRRRGLASALTIAALHRAWELGTGVGAALHTDGARPVSRPRVPRRRTLRCVGRAGHPAPVSGPVRRARVRRSVRTACRKRSGASNRLLRDRPVMLAVTSRCDGGADDERARRQGAGHRGCLHGGLELRLA